MGSWVVPQRTAHVGGIRVKTQQSRARAPAESEHTAVW
jgi:hypothetical protein